jgi:hypothetical protein
MSTKATFAVDHQTKRLRIAYTIVNNYGIAQQEVWLHCSKGKKRNEQGFSVRCNLYNGQSTSATTINSTCIDRSTFITEMNMFNAYQPWQVAAQSIWTNNFGEPEQSAKSLKRSGPEADAASEPDDDRGSFKRPRTTKEHDTATEKHPAPPTSKAIGSSPTVELDAEFDRETVMNDDEIEAAYYAHDQPVSVHVIRRMVFMLKRQANTVEPPPFELVDRIRANFAYPKPWQCIELRNWADQAIKQGDGSPSDDDHTEEEE